MSEIRGDTLVFGTRGGARKEKRCPVTKQEFIDHAPHELVFTAEDGSRLVLVRRMWDSGTFGWEAVGDTTVAVNGKEVPVNFKADFFCTHSKRG